MSTEQTSPRQRFYIFDLDDNTFFLNTKVFIVNKKSGEEKGVSTHQFASIRNDFGKQGSWKEWGLHEDVSDSYRNFRDHGEEGVIEHLIADIDEVVSSGDNGWRGPAFKMFRYACERELPLAIVTARGHERDTIQDGIRVLVRHGALPKEPNYLKLYAVSNPSMQQELISKVSKAEREKLNRLIDAGEDPTSLLKRIAIKDIVKEGFIKYGDNNEHTFGMSDDDPKNVDLALKAMCDCKKEYIHNRFFVINTHHGEHVKMEVFPIDYSVTTGMKYVGHEEWM